VRLPEPPDDLDPAFGGWGKDAMLIVLRKVGLSGEPSLDRSAEEEDRNVGRWGLEFVCCGLDSVVSRGDEEGVLSFKGSCVGGAILPTAGDCVLAGRLFLDFGVGIGGRAPVGGSSAGRVGCGSAVAIMEVDQRRMIRPLRFFLRKLERFDKLSQTGPLAKKPILLLLRYP
jgi:hypothetical protein